MKIYRVDPEAELPSYGTEDSACFDLKARLKLGAKLKAYNSTNREYSLVPAKLSSTGETTIRVHPMHRVLVPTGLIFDIPKNNVLKLYVRSSVAFKRGIALGNSTAVIDSDYVNETYVMIINFSDTMVTIADGERIAQGQLQKVEKISLTERKTPPGQKTDRSGGVGSTGK